MRRTMPCLTLVLLLMPLVLAGCVGAVVAGGAAVGSAAIQERSLGAAADDQLIGAQVREAILERGLGVSSNIDVTVTEGRVLLLGTVADPDDRVEVVRAAWNVSGVREVLNELEVTGGRSVGTFANDTRISTQVRSRLLGAEEVRSINYSIDTISGVVYLMGVARTSGELDRVIELARTVPGVMRVVSYVRTP